MKHKRLIRTGAAALLGCAALVAAYQAGKTSQPREVRVVEREIVEVPVPMDAPLVVPVPVPVAVPFAIELRGRPAGAGVPVDLADPGVEVDPDLCVQNSPDGSRVMWIRSQDRRNITKYDFAADGSLSFLTNLRTDAAGNPLGAKIYDGSNELLYKTMYGYHKTTGALVTELLFDTRAEQVPGQKEEPLRRVTYATDADDGQVEATRPDPALAENEPPPLPSPFSSRAFPHGQ